MLSEERWGQWKGDDVSRFFFFIGLKFFQTENFLWNVWARNDISNISLFICEYFDKFTKSLDIYQQI